ncbi:DUF2087 domain-containing protein [Brevibacillus sp. SYP-B805]|uniref:DUF2087 domain-containing protein n=1 Tax=Brevibacillus sp. SYP-B805 TaxID=1578199 RepID=UPI0013EDB52C|nr:DUF2087 domain-containing protein [Brevibacillus sp. SYP-B805]NGQ97340.1 DUF2087 domain-containing protein [Brevibacillus sp. SYP-B805]
MNDLSDLFWNASVEELQKGYVYQEESDQFVCLVCGKHFVKGMIYTDEGLLYEAEKYVTIHIGKEHESMFAYLLQLDKRITGLTDLQKKLLWYFHQGYSDKEIVKELEGGSTSTIRHHRFTLREKEKQAKVFLAIMGLLEKQPVQAPAFISIPKSATVPDERFAITEEENAEILQAYFPDGPDGRLSHFPKKEKKKAAILRHIIKRFEPHRKYTEKEVNQILKGVHEEEYVTIRRYLIEYGLMSRYDDCSYYWVNV